MAHKQAAHDDASSSDDSILHDVLRDHFGDAKERVFGTSQVSPVFVFPAPVFREKSELRRNFRLASATTGPLSARRRARMFANPPVSHNRPVGARKRKSTPRRVRAELTAHNVRSGKRTRQPPQRYRPTAAK